MEELLLTEVEYVRSLAYILTHYLPLLAQPDVPPDLRGQRGRIFGNLENLYAFHCHYFLQELEACRTEPIHVGRCFLRHVSYFDSGLIFLYCNILFLFCNDFCCSWLISMNVFGCRERILGCTLSTARTSLSQTL